jgi:hypothetical protein
MKIVRLIEDGGNATAYFDNTFNDEIELAPFSEVALASIAINTNPTVIEISNKNEQIYEDTVGNILMTHGTYNLDNYDDLMFSIESSFNDTMGLKSNIAGKAGAHTANSEVGRQWICTEDKGDSGFGKDGKVSVGFRCANYEGPAEEAWGAKQIDVGVETGLDATVKRNGGTPSEADATLASKEYLTWGVGRFYVRLETFTTTDDPSAEDQGIYIGLTRTDHATLGTHPTLDECVFGIHAINPTVPYQLNQGTEYYEDGNEAQTGAKATQGDIIGFERYGGSIHAVQYAFNTATPTRILMTAYEEAVESALKWSANDKAGSPLYPVIIMLGEATKAVVDQVQISPDAIKLFQKQSYTPIVKTNGKWGMQNGATTQQSYLDFQDANSGSRVVSTFLGFVNPRQPAESGPDGGMSTMDADAFSWNAGKLFGPSLKGQGYYVELMTGTCEGYDGMTHQRKNVLAVIPESDSDEKLLFQPSFPIFLEMNNSHPLILRNIRARMLQADGSALQVSGFNSMTLLFK